MTKQIKTQTEMLKATRFKRSAFRLVAAAALIGTGAYMFGQGAFLYAKAQLADVLLEQAWTDTLADASGGKAGALNKPWPWADMTPIAKVEAPRLGQEEIVLSQASGEAMAFAPGWVTSSAKPGTQGVSVIAAHRNTHFRFLKDVKNGDDIKLTTADGKVRSYKVTGQEVVRWNKSGIDPHASGNTLALVTCWPIDSMERGPMRLVVYAEAAKNPPANGAAMAAR